MKLKRDPMIREDELRQLADSLLQEASCLLDGNYFTAAIYLGGYAIECLLKVTICRALRQPALTSMFKSHDLDGLLFYSGLHQDMILVPDVHEAFNSIVGAWNDQDGNTVRRYAPRSDASQEDAEKFLDWVKQVYEWLVARI